MAVAGIDMGAKYAKVVILKDGQPEILAQGTAEIGFDLKEAAEEAFNQALKSADLSRDDVTYVVATGASVEAVPFATDTVSMQGAAARGAHFLMPSVRTVIDIGAEMGRAAKCDGTGKMVDFVLNERCAAGAGAFIEAMSRALEVELEQFGPLSLEADKSPPMNAQCTIFAESEVVTLIHEGESKKNIIRALHDAIAERNISMVRRLGVEPDVALIGGLAKNVGFVDAMKRGLEMDVLIPEDPLIVGALGAALVAADRQK
ncbi:MAG: acyl-CoA dehydratase activase [Anaerolineae bacterium]|nr:acyl-CoA dehydratase activase [Anaerolineae bacterium]